MCGAPRSAGEICDLEMRQKTGNGKRETEARREPVALSISLRLMRYKVLEPTLLNWRRCATNVLPVIKHRGKEAAIPTHSWPRATLTLESVSRPGHNRNPRH